MSGPPPASMFRAGRPAPGREEFLPRCKKLPAATAATAAPADRVQTVAGPIFQCVELPSRVLCGKVYRPAIGGTTVRG